MQFVFQPRIIYATFFILTALYLSPAVLAQEPEATDIDSEAQTTAVEPISDIPPVTPATRTTPLRIELPATAQTRITNLAANMSNRMEAVTNRMQNVVNRLQSRLDIMDSQGFNTSSARTELAIAQNHIMTAGATLASVDAQVATFVGSESPRNAWNNLKTTYTTAGDSLRAAHLALRGTIAAAKVARTSASDISSASSTETNITE